MWWDYDDNDDDDDDERIDFDCIRNWIDSNKQKKIFAYTRKKIRNSNANKNINQLQMLPPSLSSLLLNNSIMHTPPCVVYIQMNQNKQKKNFGNIKIST